jgi:hypothetical protein
MTEEELKNTEKNLEEMRKKLQTEKIRHDEYEGRFQTDYTSALQNLEKLEERLGYIAATKSIPKFSLEDRTLSFKSPIGKDEEEEIPIDNLSLAIFRLGELVRILDDKVWKDDYSEELKEFQDIYNSLPTGYRAQLKLVFDGVLKLIKMYGKKE